MYTFLWIYYISFSFTWWKAEASCKALKSLEVRVWMSNFIPHITMLSLQWRHNEQNDVSNHQPHDCLLGCLFRRRSKKISKLCVTGLCEGNSPVTGEFPLQRVSNAENVSIWWCHHANFSKPLVNERGPRHHLARPLHYDLSRQLQIVGDKRSLLPVAAWCQG